LESSGIFVKRNSKRIKIHIRETQKRAETLVDALFVKKRIEEGLDKHKAKDEKAFCYLTVTE